MEVEGGSGGGVVGAEGYCAVLYRVGRCKVHRALAVMKRGDGSSSLGELGGVLRVQPRVPHHGHTRASASSERA
jgi:hypothetical protein